MLVYVDKNLHGVGRQATREIERERKGEERVCKEPKKNPGISTKGCSLAAVSHALLPFKLGNKCNYISGLSERQQKGWVVNWVNRLLIYPGKCSGEKVKKKRERRGRPLRGVLHSRK